VLLNVEVQAVGVGDAVAVDLDRVEVVGWIK